MESARRDNLPIVETEFEQAFPQIGRKRFRLTVSQAESDGKQLLVLWFQDIAGRDQAAVLDLLHDSVILRDMNNRIRFWNRSAASLYGWTASEAFGKVSHELLHTQFPKPVEKLEAELNEVGV
jgi:PAS domain-containing protein